MPKSLCFDLLQFVLHRSHSLPALKDPILWIYLFSRSIISFSLKDILLPISSILGSNLLFYLLLDSLDQFWKNNAYCPLYKNTADHSKTLSSLIKSFQLINHQTNNNTDVPSFHPLVTLGPWLIVCTLPWSFDTSVLAEDHFEEPYWNFHQTLL